MSGRVLRWALVVSIAWGGVLATVPRAFATDPGEDLLQRAQEAAAAYDYTGVVTISWSDAAGRHTQKVRVSGTRGMLRVGDRAIVSAGSRRLVRERGDWLMLWNTGDVAAYPSVGRKYELTVRPGRNVAGRSTTVVDAVLDGSRAVHERLFVDDESGLLLRREQLDGHGRVLRAVGFSRISDPTAAGSKRSRDVPSPRMQQHRVAPRPVDRVGSAFRAPSRVGKGYRLVGRYRHADGTMQLLYSDGLFSMSVFEQPGTLEWGALPADGRSVELADQRANTYVVAGGVAAVWAHDELVFTCVTDAPMADVEPVVDAMTTRPHRSVWSSMADAVLAPFSWG